MNLHVICFYFYGLIHVTNSAIIAVFFRIKDPKVKRIQLILLDDIIAIDIYAVICGAENWTEIEDFAYAKEEFFRQIIDLSNGIPSYDTFGRVFAALDPCAFAEGFTAWVQTLVSD